MSVRVHRIQLRSPVSFMGKTFESLSMGDDGKDREWTATVVQGGVQVRYKAKSDTRFLYIPDGNLASVDCEPEKTNGASSAKVKA